MEAQRAAEARDQELRERAAKEQEVQKLREQEAQRIRDIVEAERKQFEEKKASEIRTVREVQEAELRAAREAHEADLVRAKERAVHARYTTPANWRHDVRRGLTHANSDPTMFAISPLKPQAMFVQPQSAPQDTVSIASDAIISLALTRCANVDTQGEILRELDRIQTILANLSGDQSTLGRRQALEVAGRSRCETFILRRASKKFCCRGWTPSAGRGRWGA